MASSAAKEIQTLEEQAIAEVERMENNYHLGMSVNLTKRFSELRGSGSLEALPPVKAAVKQDPETGEIIPNADKYWMNRKDIWDTDFATMRNDLQDLRELYRDQSVVTFNDAADKRRNARIKVILKKLQRSFKEMKGWVDKLNVDLYAKDKMEANRGEGNLFETVSEWRIAERIAIDLTARLKAKQTELNVLIQDNDARIDKLTKGVTTTTGNKRNDAQIQQLERVLAEERGLAMEQETQDVKEIVEAVQQIVKMVQDMSTMITEQGTIVDRIDYNLEVASARTLRGEKHFKEAEKYNKKAAGLTMWCIACLVLLNTILLSVIIAKTK